MCITVSTSSFSLLFSPHFLDHFLGLGDERNVVDCHRASKVSILLG